MKYEFSDSKIERQCKDFAYSKRVLGMNGAKNLKHRLEDLEAAVTVKDLLVGKPHPLKGDRFGQFALTVIDGKRLIFVPDMNPIPKKQDNGIDWAAVDRVKICDIEDYHGHD